jgi:hypothetical protein
MATATLKTTVQIDWQDYRGRDRDAECEVTYTYDGDDLRITDTRFVGFVDGGYDIDLIDELVWNAVSEEADAAYAEWQAERDEGLAEARAAESYIPPMKDAA